MQKIGTILGYIILFSLVGYGIWGATAYNAAHNLPPSREPAIVVGGGSTAPVTWAPYFDQTGTLIYYPNNVGPVPYILYYDFRGRPLTKALVVPDTVFSALSLEHYAYQQIRITGVVEDEHVRVLTLQPLS